MNIDNILELDTYKNDLVRIQGSLSGHGLTSADTNNYKRRGSTHTCGNPKLDTIFCYELCTNTNPPQFQTHCLCGRQIKNSVIHAMVTLIMLMISLLLVIAVLKNVDCRMLYMVILNRKLNVLFVIAF